MEVVSLINQLETGMFNVINMSWMIRNSPFSKDIYLGMFEG